jgi:translocation and assembly module TamA
MALEGRVFPRAWDVASPFGGGRAEVAGYAPLPGRALLALRAGGEQVWGDPPLYDLATLGGSRSLRGVPRQRFVGDAALFGGAELRAMLARINLVVRGDLGILAFAEAGRVYLDSASPGDWHRSQGAGVWLDTLGRSFSATYARGEEDRLYLKLGMPF